MRFYTRSTLPFLLGVASASQEQQLLRSSRVLEATGITQIVNAKTEKARKVAEWLRSLKESRDLQEAGDATPELYEDGDGIFDFDFGGDGMGDLDLGGLGLCDNEPMELFNVRCSCTLATVGEDGEGSKPLTDIGDIMGEFSNIMKNGINMGFDCSTVDPHCYENDCGNLRVKCDMTMDFNDMANSSFDCDTCVEYTEPPEGSNGVMNADDSLCINMNLCAPEIMAEKASDGLGFAMSDILCGCSATLNNNGDTCACGVCGDISQGVELTCEGMKSSCTDTGFENLDASDSGSLASATSFMPQFTATDPDTSAATSPQAVAPFFISALAFAFVTSLC